MTEISAWAIVYDGELCETFEDEDDARRLLSKYKPGATVIRLTGTAPSAKKSPWPLHLEGAISITREPPLGWNITISQNQYGGTFASKDVGEQEMVRLLRALALDADEETRARLVMDLLEGFSIKAVWE